jgi:uncharacterized phage-associated protein
MTRAQTAGLPIWPFTLDIDKTVEAVLYVAAQIPDPTFHSISKVLFHADKAHISRYARPISGDRYIAMRHGPVPSATYDMFRTLRGDAAFPLPNRAREGIRVDGYAVRVSLPADETVLSDSDIECLAESARIHGSKSFTQRKAESHGPAWLAADENDVIALEALLLEIENGDELRQHFALDGV